MNSCGCDAACQISWDGGRCCYHTDLNATQGEVCDGCYERNGGMPNE